MVRMNFIFMFISSSDTNLLRKKSVKQKIKKRWPYLNILSIFKLNTVTYIKTLVNIEHCLKFRFNKSDILVENEAKNTDKPTHKILK